MYEHKANQEKMFEEQAAIFSRIILDRFYGEDESQSVGIYPSNQGWASFYNWDRSATTKTLNKSYDTAVASDVEENISDLNTVESDEKRVADLIYNLSQTQSIKDRKTIAQRLFDLVEDLKDDEQEIMGMSLDSLRSFYSFMQLHGDLKKPAIGLTPSNEIYVSWKADNDSVFSIHFLNSEDARFAIITTNIGQKVSLSGTTNPHDLIEKVKPWGVIKWAERKEPYGTAD
jgi:hypothetical protein